MHRKTMLNIYITNAQTPSFNSFFAIESSGAKYLVFGLMRGSRVGQGVRTPLPPKNHKNIGFLSNTVPDPLNNHKKTGKPAFNVGQSLARQRNAISMAFCWRADDGPLLVIFGPPSSNKSQSRTPSEKTCWIRAWF